MDDELKVTGLKRWDDAVLERDGSARNVTKVRVWLGTHGPFEQTFDRDVDLYAIQEWIRKKREELTQLQQL